MKALPVYLAIFFAVLCMSTSSIMIRFCSAPAFIIALYRLIMTTGIAGLWEGLALPKKVSALSKRDFRFMCVSGLFLALHLAAWISSLSYTSISSSVLFTNLQVIFVLAFSLLFLREKVNRTVTAGIAIAVAGSCLVAAGDLQHGRLAGDMLALASGAFIAVYYITGRYIRVRVDTMTYTFIVSGVASLVLLFTTWGMGLALSGYQTIDWVLFFLMALGPGIGGHAVFNWALKYVKAPLVSVSILGESVGASILGYLIFQEALLWYQMSGGALILLGIYLAVSYEQKNQPAPVQ